MRRTYNRSILCLMFLIVVLFTIGCLFIYWAIDNYVGNNFDSNRYAMSKIQANGNDTYMVWKFDKRTGGIELCAKTTNTQYPVVCLKPKALDTDELPKDIEIDHTGSPMTQKQCTEVVTSVLEEMERWEDTSEATAPTAKEEPKTNPSSKAPKNR